MGKREGKRKGRKGKERCKRERGDRFMEFLKVGDYCL